MVATRLRTVEELETMPGGEEFELFDGVAREHPGMSVEHGFLGFEIGGPLYAFVKRHQLGRLFTSDTQFLLSRNPDTVVKPDVSFIRAERMPPPEAYALISRVPPDFAVEVVSPGDRMAEVRAKVARYRAAGVPMVWVVDPQARAVTVYVLDREPQTLREGDVLDGGEVFPGFRLPIADIFT